MSKIKFDVGTRVTVKSLEDLKVEYESQGKSDNFLAAFIDDDTLSETVNKSGVIIDLRHGNGDTPGRTVKFDFNEEEILMFTYEFELEPKVLDLSEAYNGLKD